MSDSSNTNFYNNQVEIIQVLNSQIDILLKSVRNVIARLFHKWLDLTRNVRIPELEFNVLLVWVNVSEPKEVIGPKYTCYVVNQSEMLLKAVDLREVLVTRVNLNVTCGCVWCKSDLWS